MSIILVIIVMASAVSIMSTDIYVPSLPDLPGYFDTSANIVKLTISLNIITYGISQLIHGPLSERFGRRPVMLGGIILFALSSLACALSQTINQLIVARMVQGFTASVEMVLALAIIRDVYKGADRIRALSIYGMSLPACMIIAPLIGGYIHITLGWQVNFIVIAVAAVLVSILIFFYLPESTIQDRKALEFHQLASDYIKLLTSTKFMGYTVMVGAGFGTIYAFITAAPFILISRLGIATEHYGFYQGITIIAFFSGSLFANRTAGRIPTDHILKIGFICTAVGSLILVSLVFAGLESALNLSLSMSIITFGMGPIYAIAPFKALDATDSRTGNASAIISSFEMLIGGVASMCIGLFHDGTSYPLAITLLILLVLTGVSWWTAGEQFRKRNH